MCLKNGIDCVVSNVFFEISSFYPYIHLANLYGAKYKVIVMTHVFGNVHNVPPDVIRSMNENWENFDYEEVFKY